MYSCLALAQTFPVHLQLCLRAHAGCIFHYDKDFPEGSGKGFKESDKPNFTGSYYSYTKVCLCLILHVYRRDAWHLSKHAVCM